MKKVAIYAGRFQPFHKGHYSAYEALVKEFGKDNVYIATSGIQDSDRNPFSFEEKRDIMSSLYGIPSDRIVKCRVPYRPEEILNKFNPDTTMFVTTLGQKDAERFGDKSYFQKYDRNTSTEPMKTKGYYVSVPTFQFGKDAMSATRIRDVLGSQTTPTREKIDFFKKVYGKFDKRVFHSMVKTLRQAITQTKDPTYTKTLPGSGSEPEKRVNRRKIDLNRKIRNPVTRRDIKIGSALQYDKDHPAYRLAKKMFVKGGVNEVFNSVLVENALINQYNSLVDQFIVGETNKTAYRIEVTDDIDTIERKCKDAYKSGVFFYPLLHALRMAKAGHVYNDDPESPSDLGSSGMVPVEKDKGDEVDEEKSSTERVRRFYKRHPKRVKQYLRKTVKDRVARNRDRAKAVKKHGKAKMKNHDVHHPNGPNGGSWKLAKKDHGRDKKKKNEEVTLTEAGSAGHMLHPYEDTNLTFSDYKEIISRGMTGNLGQEGEVTEKLDGQNIAFTVVDGQILFARNKSHTRNRGKGAMTVRDIMKMFSDRSPELQRAFVGAAKDLEAAIKMLPPEKMKQIFSDGKNFMSTEIILPDTENVIPYNKTVLVFHGTIEFDDAGEKVGASRDSAKILSRMVSEVGAQKQKLFGIEGPKIIAFDSYDSSKNQEELAGYVKQIDELRDKFNLSDSDSVKDYYINWWTDYIKNELKKEKIQFGADDLYGMVGRFAFGDKSQSLSSFRNPQLRQWVSQFEKEKLKEVSTESKKPFEMIFLKVGASILKNINGLLASNNPEAANKIRRQIDSIMSSVKSDDTSEAAQKMRMEFDRLEQVGLDKLVPSEGIVFLYKGRPYKFTGTFAPINQLLGTFKYGRTGATKPEGPAAQPAPKGGEDKKAFIKQFYDKTIRNPLTGKEITIQSALTYDHTHPAYKAATQFLSQQLNK